MKELFLPLVLLTVLAAGVYYSLGGSATPPFHLLPLTSAEPVKAEAAMPPPAPAKAPPAKRRTSAPVEPVPEPLPQPAPQPASVSLAQVLQPAPAAAPPSRPVVDPSQISVGMPSAQVINRFGQPSLTATTIESGNLIETYVYLGDRPGELTRIHLENGRVSAPSGHE
jgi:hypothetical protein